MKNHVNRITKQTTCTLTSPENTTIAKMVNILKEAEFMESENKETTSSLRTALTEWQLAHTKKPPEAALPLFDSGSGQAKRGRKEKSEIA